MGPINDETAVPGTIYLVDLTGGLQIKHAKDQKDIVLVPSPSDNPDDPLNWTRSRKLLSTVCLAVFVWSLGFCSFTANAALVEVSEGLGVPLATLNSGAGYLFLLAGWGNLFWQPVALQFGKRPVYIISAIANVALTAWTPSIRSTNQVWANKILTGFFAGPIESLCEITVADVYFAHERSTYMAVYAFSLTGSNFFAPVIGGFIADYAGWQWCYYIPAIIAAVGTLFLLLFMEETNFQRESSRPAETNLLQESGDEKMPTSSINSAHGDGSRTTAVMQTQTKTYRQRLKLFHPQAKNDLWRRFTQPLYCLSWPVVFWAGFAYGSNLIWFNVLNATASLILSGPPYGFSASMVGLSFLAAFLGTVVAAYYTGPACDWLSIRLSRRNGGTFEPEFRLWLFCANIIFIPGSLILWGVGAAHGIHWFGLTAAMFFIAITVITGCTLSINYAIDSYHALGADVMVTVMLVRNTMSFAIGYGITPWIENLGYQNCFISAAMVGLVCACSFLPMIKFGKRLRARSAQKYWRIIKENTE